MVGALGHARVSAGLADLGACPSAGFRSLDAEFHTTGPPFTPRAALSAAAGTSPSRSDSARVRTAVA